MPRTHSTVAKYWGQFLLGTGLLFCLNGCELDYYLHLARGQARIVLGCEPIDDLLTADRLDSLSTKKLLLIQTIRRYGTGELGLKESDSYTCFYDTGDDPVSWNVSASPPDSMVPYLWHFPIAGAVPYKGFFVREKAQEEYDRLIAEGYDVLLRPVSAYSTLGYFADPVLSDMLEYPIDSLADLILHELTHSTIYVKGQTDFNESLATFVGRNGSLAFLSQHYGADSPLIEDALKRREDTRRFREFMVGVVDSLDSLYSIGLSREEVLRRREEVFARSKERYRQIRAQFTLLNYDGFLKWEVNNARLLSYRRYHSKQDEFSALFEAKKSNLPALLQVCKSCADSPDPWQCIDDSVAVYSPVTP